MAPCSRFDGDDSVILIARVGEAVSRAGNLPILLDSHFLNAGSVVAVFEGGGGATSPSPRLMQGASEIERDHTREDPMTTNWPQEVPLGELVAIAFDIAAEINTDPQEISRLATAVVTNILRRQRKPSPLPRATAMNTTLSAAA